MARTYVVTGSASGIGRATCERLASDGHRVLDVDLRDASILADVSTPEGRDAMVAAVTEAAAPAGSIDAVVANAGVSDPAELCVKVNYFGAVATLDGLRPLLARGDQPRAVVTASSSILNGADPALLEACLAGDETRALELAGPVGLLAYPTTKTAIARWARRTAPTADWAGAGIGLNAVAPGVVRTPMTDPLFADPAMKELMDGAVPMPYQGYMEPAHVAHLIAFLASGDTRRITGQVVFIDGGADVVLRGDDVF